MNETTINQIVHHTENINTQNIQNSQCTTQSNKTVVIKNNPYQVSKQKYEKTPKTDVITKNNNSSQKINRVNSMKGINVLSVRPASSQKQVKQFYTADNALEKDSQITIKQNNSSLLQYMRQQLKKTQKKYEDKMNQELAYQYNFLTAQIDTLKQTLSQNELKLGKQQFELNQLLIRVQKIQKNIEIKTNLMEKQLTEFKKFYEQCYIYTNKRISEVEFYLHSITNYIQQITTPTEKIQCWKYIEYANSLIKNIVTANSASTSSLKYYLDSEIYQLEVQLGRFHDEYEKLDGEVHKMKEVKFGNESLENYLKILQKTKLSNYNITNSPQKDSIMNSYQPKFKQIIKRINNSSIEIDLIRTFLTTETETQTIKLVEQELKIEELTKIITILNKKIDEDKIWYTKQIQQKQSILGSYNIQKLQLETKLHSSNQCQIKILKQLAQLKLKLTYYQNKCQKYNEREYIMENIMTETMTENLVKERTKFLQENMSIKQKKIQQLQQTIKTLDYENYVLTEKLSKNEQKIKENINLLSEYSLATKIIQQYKQNRRKLVDENQQSKKQIQKLTKLINSLETKTKISQQTRNMVMYQKVCLFHKNEQQLHSQVDKLQQTNNELYLTNQQLITKNNELENDLHTYAETFEKQSITFRNALEKLKKQNDFLSLENKKIHELYNTLKIDIENNTQHNKTMQSFYDNSSTMSLQFRKTVSTELSSEPRVFKKTQSQNRQTKLDNLKINLKKQKYQLPVICQIDYNGYLKEETTGCYLCDQNRNHYQLDKKDLGEAVKMGIILL